MDTIRIVIVDDLEDMRNYFKTILAHEKGIEIVGMASSGKEAFEVVMETKPDIVLMDIQMETELAGIEAIQKIKASLDAVKIIVITIHEEDEILFKAYASGAMDYIIKTSSIVDIINSIRNVYSNKLLLRNEIAEKIVSEFSRMKNEQSSMMYTLNIISKLTTAEFEILKVSYQGLTCKQIAKSRHVEEVTIRTQIARILKKFQKENMKEVVILLKELRFFEVYG